MSSFVNLLLQFGLMATLVVAVLYAKRVRFGIHGTIMSAVVALNLLSILLVMLPSAVRILSSSAPVELKVTTAVHSLAGAAAELFSAYIVLVWRFRSPGTPCFKLGGQMRRVSILWTAMMVLGCLIYVILYVPQILG